MSVTTTTPDFNAYSVRWFKSQHEIVVAGEPNKTSCGGAIDTDEIPNFTVHNLFDKVTDAEADLGKTEFRCYYVKNLHPSEPIRNPLLLIVQNTASPDDQIAIGWGTSPINGVEQTIATESTYPTNVTFTEAPTRTEAAVLGINIPPGGHKAIWVRRIVSFNAAEHPQNGAIIRLMSSNVVDEVLDVDQMPQPDTDTSFSAVGEFDDSFTMKEIYDRIRGRNSNLHISTGNMSTATASAGSATTIAGPGGAIATAGGVTAIAGQGVMDRTRMSFGKNDSDNTGKENFWKNRQGIKNKYSSYQFQNVHFLFMDTDSGKENWDESSQQYEFVIKDLTDAASNPANDWIFVISNRIMYASQTTTETKFILKELRELYVPIFQDKGVHIVMQGDIHNYQRSYPIHWDQTDADEDGIPDQDSDTPTLIQSVNEPDYSIPIGLSSIEESDQVGCIFMVDGTGGADRHDIVGPSFFTVANNAEDAGYIEFFLRNTDTERKITGVFYRMPLIEDQEDNSGENKKYKYGPDTLDDKFTITKNLPEPSEG